MHPSLISCPHAPEAHLHPWQHRHSLQRFVVILKYLHLDERIPGLPDEGLWGERNMVSEGREPEGNMTEAPGYKYMHTIYIQSQSP